jgi:V8-like Glu-specific endopeptidase
MLRLIQEAGAHAGRTLTFQQDRVGLGRQPASDVPFDPNIDRDASGNHCEILREHGQYVLVDLASRNGTFVNGVRVSRQVLSHGAVIECGRGGPRFRVELAGAPALSGPPGPPSVGPSLAAPSAFSPPFAQPSGGPFAPVPAPTSGSPAPFAPPATPIVSPPPSPPSSVGAAAAAQLPPGAQIGKRTVALMIDQALAASENKRSVSGGTKLAIALFAVLLLAGLGGFAIVMSRGARTDEAPTPASGGEQISAQFEGAIYLLAAQIPNTSSPRGFCTGFAVTPTLIATNAHCIDAGRQFLDRGSTLVAMPSSGRGARIPVVPVYRDSRFRNPQFGTEGSGFDVGLVRANVPLATQVRVASNDALLNLRTGSQLFVFGFPGLTMNETSPVATITQGVLNRSTDFFERAAEPASAQKIQHSAQTTSGSSGSPIFLANGDVVGVNAGSLSDEERQRILDPRTGQTTSVEVNRSSNFKYGIRADIIRAAVSQVGETLP